MRALFIIAVLWCLSCAGGYQSVEEFGSTNQLSIPSLSYPIYLVPDYGFFLACDKMKNANKEICKKNRLRAVAAGAEQWQEYFRGQDRLAIIVVLPEDLPAYTFNPPVYLQVDPDGCKDVQIPTSLTLLACYQANAVLRKIIFLKDENITSRIAAHEIGHALGVDRTIRTNIDGSHPIMSEPIGSDHVTFLDIEQLCKVHLCPWHGEDRGTFDKVVVSQVTSTWSEMLP